MTYRQAFYLLGCLFLWACATLDPKMPPISVETWIVVPQMGSIPAHLRHHHENSDISLSIDQAAGFSCYSEQDDMAIRNLIKALRASEGAL